MRNYITFLFLALCSFMVTLPLTGCGGSSAAQAGVVIHTPGDLVLLAGLAGEKAQFEVSTSSVADVREGKASAALLGREPAEGEMTGLTAHLIAYDAACIVVDTASYEGGEYWASPRYPSRKTEGLRGLTTDDLKGMFSFWVRPPAERWTWSGAYFSWRSAQFEEQQGWVEERRALFPAFTYPPGKFDVQTALYQKLGLDELAISKSWQSFTGTGPNQNTEEEILTFAYKGTQLDFPFQIGFASRRVAAAAIQRLPVKVLPIDGIDPIADAQAVYDGRYSLSRKMYLVVPENPTSETQALVDYLLSEQGQQAIADIGYLPLP